ncbi:hypothetical protein IT41_10780 [Paracoccus halophilus]|nr:hypothetical protein [Paracoccus halophilus]KGJ04374.1 hypothetical protein IT41_10780 [Paracoccus halophilus]
MVTGRGKRSTIDEHALPLPDPIRVLRGNIRVSSLVNEIGLGAGLGLSRVVTVDLIDSLLAGSTGFRRARRRNHPSLRPRPIAG